MGQAHRSVEAPGLGSALVPSSSTFSFAADVWLHEGSSAAWHFLSVPPDVADDIEAGWGHRAAGFGSVRVEVRIGGSTWATSVFPDAKRETYVLPVKKQVRTAEGIVDGTTVEVMLTVIA